MTQALDPCISKSGDAGFTLLEMLVVLALLTMLTIALTGTVFLGIKAQSRITSVTGDQEDYSSFRRIMTLELGRAYPDWITIGQYKGIDFAGTSKSLAFLGPALETEGPGLAHYLVSLSQWHGQPAIILQSDLSETVPAATFETHFAVGLLSLRCQYFGFSRDGSSRIWQNDWIMRSNPPDLVAVQITFPKGDRRSWPLLIVHPAIDSDISCEIDPQTHRCAGR